MTEAQAPLELLVEIQNAAVPVIPKRRWTSHFWQVVRFGIVGLLNTIIDVGTLNILLWFLPTHNANILLGYNSLAYLFGALNSYGLNKYWTFKHKSATTGGELLRFAIVNVTGIVCNDSIIWGVAQVLHPLITNALIWANVSKGSAVLGTMMISYFGMRLWVFARHPQQEEKRVGTISLASMESADSDFQPAAGIQVAHMETPHATKLTGDRVKVKLKQSISVILPAHNEEEAIAETVNTSVDALREWTDDFEVIVVNDGSVDRTPAIVEAIAETESRVRLITHPVNQGYGAALVSGFEAITKDLAFFMDSDGQFDIRDLERFFLLIEQYDAVLGYRIHRQDTWMRKLNAWGWKMLVRNILGVHVRDVDCAFKLYRSEFFLTHPLETRGAMINAEILYKLKRAGYTYTQVGVQHLPRRGGKATGARPAVIIRAFRELFVFARKWHREERAGQAATHSRLS